VNLDAVQQGLELATGGAALAAVVAGGLWAYVKYVVEKGLLAPAEFTVTCRELGARDEQRMLEVLLHLKNLGTTVLIAHQVEVRLRYLTSTDPLQRVRDRSSPRYGRLVFPHVATRDTLEADDPSAIPVVRTRTFVQGGVDQTYTVVALVPEAATEVLVKASFRYANRPSTLQGLALTISRLLGLSNYPLDSITRPHTAERAFRVGPPAARAPGAGPGGEVPRPAAG
jgi:hypothetical protein